MMECLLFNTWASSSHVFTVRTYVPTLWLHMQRGVLPITPSHKINNFCLYIQSVFYSAPIPYGFLKFFLCGYLLLSHKE